MADVTAEFLNAAMAAGAGLTAVHDVRGVPVTVLPDTDGSWTYEVVDIEKHLPNPSRKTGTIVVRDVTSFVAYVQRHKELGSLGFADSAGTIRCVLDHHEPENEQGSGEAGWGQHVVQLMREATTAWKAWTLHNGKWLTQEQFATFLEDRIAEIIEPPGAELFELAKFFEASKTIGFSSARRLDNGEVQLTWAENIEGKGRTGQQTVPTEFTVLLRPYKDAPAPADGQPDASQFVATARLRWRLNQQAVTFAFMLGEEVEQFLDGVHAAAVEQVRAETGVTVLLGGIAS